MADRPIIFSAPMIRALLAGRKTQTRRCLTPRALLAEPSRFQKVAKDKATGRAVWEAWDGSFPCNAFRAGVDCSTPIVSTVNVGDRLWVRESCRAEERSDGCDGIRYVADSDWRMIENSAEAANAWVALNHYRSTDEKEPRGEVVPSIHMPRWASRITLIVEDVRIERLCRISVQDCYAEGIDRPAGPFMGSDVCGRDNARNHYRALWNSLHDEAGDTWADNPWIVAATFSVVPGNIDKL